MAPMNGYTTTPHHRQNRRRERPGSRTRRTITRKASLQHDCHEGLLDARDTSISLPSDHNPTRPSPLLKQNFEQSWLRWKAREAEEKALLEMDMLQIRLMEEEEQRRLLYGDGDASDDDDKYLRMGALYTSDQTPEDEQSNTVNSFDLPSQYPYIIRQAKVKQPRRQNATRHSLSPLYLSFSGLSEDSDIAPFLSRSACHTPDLPFTTQYRESSPTPTLRRHMSISVCSKEDIDIPLSLPPPSAFESILLGFESSHAHNTPVSTPISQLTTSLLPYQGDWTFVTHPRSHHNINTYATSNEPSTPTTPSSEPETWILIDDS